MTTPVRIQRSRKAGYNMQAASPNGLPVVYVGRSSGVNKYGNPYDWRDFRYHEGLEGATNRELRKHAVARYRDALQFPGLHLGVALPSAEDIAELRGKNLACWCPLDSSCHADILLTLANGAQGDMARGTEVEGGV